MAKINKEKEVTKKPLKKGIGQFNLVGELKLNDFTFKIDEQSKTSDWVYNVLNLGVDCGNGNVVYAEMSGGYGAERQNQLFVHGVKEDDKKKKTDDWDNRFTIDWDDREDEDILETIGDNCFLKVGIEKQVNKKQESTFVKKFLSGYDAIAYMQEHLTDGMVVNVKGDLQFSTYNDNIQIKKVIKSIFLSKATPDKYKATFTQTMILDKDSLGKLDKEKAIYPLSVRVIDYCKMWGETEIKQNVPLNATFEIEVDKVNPSNTKKFIDMITKKSKKDLTEIIFEGDIVEGQAVTTITDEDIPEDIMELIEMGVYSREDAIGKMAIKGSREKRMIIRRPLIKMVGEEDAKKPMICIEEAKYKEEDMIFDFMIESDDEEDVEIEIVEDSTDSDVNEENNEEDTDDNAWLTALDEDE